MAVSVRTSDSIVEGEIDIQGLLPRPDHRVGQRAAEHRGAAVVVQRVQPVAAAAGGNRQSGAGIHPQLQAGAAQEHLLGELTEVLAVGERGYQGPRSFAELGEAVEVQHAQALDRAGLVEGAIVERQQTGDRLARDLCDKVHRAGFVCGGLQHRVQRHPRHVLCQQQVTFQRRGTDRGVFRQPAQETQHLGSGGADIAVQLDADDMPFSDDEAQLAGGVQMCGHRAEHIAGGSILAQNCLSRGSMRRSGTAGPVSPAVSLANVPFGKAVTPFTETLVTRTLRLAPAAPGGGRTGACSPGDTDGADGGMMRGIGEPCGTRGSLRAGGGAVRARADPAKTMPNDAIAPSKACFAIAAAAARCCDR